MVKEFTVRFLPSEQTVHCSSDEVLLEGARRNGIRIASDCGGRGRCHSCVVRIEENVPPPTAADLQDFSRNDLDAGWRRACNTHLVGQCTVHVPTKSAAETVPSGQNTGAEVVPIEVPVLEKGDQPGHWRRGKYTIVAGDRPLGMAVDLGTTNMAAAILDLQSGRVLANCAVQNPQIAYGGDVITRCMLAMQSFTTAKELQSVVVQALGELAAKLTHGHPELVAELAVVGNTVMQHLLLGLPVEQLALAPYQPMVFDAVEIPACEIGLKLAPGAFLYVGPNIAGFVGSDHVAALVETMAAPPRGNWALVDVGTNTEISLFVDGQLTCVSCASGPAFEGGIISCGMRAAPGAIYQVRSRAANLEMKTIGNAPAVGICGSGVISLLAELRRDEAVDARGRLQAAHPRVREREHGREFVLWDEKDAGALPVIFTQQDVRAVQLAKAAIRAGLELLLADVGLREDQLDHLILAGAFGMFIDIGEAVAIGMLPSLPASRIIQVGNLAGAGVRRMLACKNSRTYAIKLARQERYRELALNPDFPRAYVSRTSL
jgi:uncharacterized 2Fe-2S/4Fe-4S cluster protein (DUF4445 family)